MSLMSSLEWIEELNWSQKVCQIVISPLNLNSSSFGSLISTLFDLLFEEWIDKDENSLSGCFRNYKHESILTRISWSLSLRFKIWPSSLSNSSVFKLFKMFVSSSLTFSSKPYLFFAYFKTMQINKPQWNEWIKRKKQWKLQTP